MGLQSEYAEANVPLLVQLGFDSMAYRQHNLRWWMVKGKVEGFSGQ